MQPQSHRLIKCGTDAKLLHLFANQERAVPKMKSLILFLFLGVTVALAEIHEDNDPNQNFCIQGLVSLNSLLSFCFVAKFLNQSA